jgi:hypothetical protein
MPAAELDQLLQPVLAGKQALEKVFAPQEDGAEAELSTEEEPIAVGFEYTTWVSGQAQAGNIHAWQERRFVVRSLSLARRQEKSLRASIDRAQKEIRALNERKQGKPGLRSLEQAQAAAEPIAQAHGVGQSLRIVVKP